MEPLDRSKEVILSAYVAVRIGEIAHIGVEAAGNGL